MQPKIKKCKNAGVRFPPAKVHFGHKIAVFLQKLKITT
jgi:hypothetical protein